MPGLAADLVLLAASGQGLEWRDDVAGGRLGGIGRVLGRAGHLSRQLPHLLLQLGDAELLPPDDLLLPLDDLPVVRFHGRAREQSVRVAPHYLSDRWQAHMQA